MSPSYKPQATGLTTEGKAVMPDITDPATLGDIPAEAAHPPRAPWYRRPVTWLAAAGLVIAGLATSLALTLTASSGPVSGSSFNGNLGAKVVPAPPGFALSHDPNEHSGPMNAAGFNRYMGPGDLAASLHFVRGYDVYYDSPDGDIIEVTLFQFATPDDAFLFQAGWGPGGPANSTADPVIPGAEDFDSTTVQQDSADHGVIANKGNLAFVIDDTTSSTARVPLVETMARQQYAAL